MALDIVNIWFLLGSLFLTLAILNGIYLLIKAKSSAIRKHYFVALVVGIGVQLAYVFTLFQKQGLSTISFFAGFFGASILYLIYRKEVLKGRVMLEEEKVKKLKKDFAAVKGKITPSDLFRTIGLAKIALRYGIKKTLILAYLRDAVILLIGFFLIHKFVLQDTLTTLNIIISTLVLASLAPIRLKSILLKIK